eukprot:8192799-Alexandrium_andersonii.AAC.1
MRPMRQLALQPVPQQGCGWCCAWRNDECNRQAKAKARAPAGAATGDTATGAAAGPRMAL